MCALAISQNEMLMAAEQLLAELRESLNEMSGRGEIEPNASLTLYRQVPIHYDPSIVWSSSYQPSSLSHQIEPNASLTLYRQVPRSEGPGRPDAFITIHRSYSFPHINLHHESSGGAERSDPFIAIHQA